MIAVDRLFWRRYSDQFMILSFLQSLFNNIPATSISVERMFSAASLIMTKNRKMTDDEHFSDLCIAKSFERNIKFKRINLEDCNLTEAMEITTNFSEPFYEMEPSTLQNTESLLEDADSDFGY